MTVSEAKQACNMVNWNKMVTAQKESGLTIKQWCIQNNVSESTFTTRQRKLRAYALEHMQGPMPLSESTRIENPMPTINLARVEFQTKASEKRSADITIRKNGADIEFSQSLNPELIKSIIAEVLHA